MIHIDLLETTLTEAIQQYADLDEWDLESVTVSRPHVRVKEKLGWVDHVPGPVQTILIELRERGTEAAR